MKHALLLFTIIMIPAVGFASPALELFPQQFPPVLRDRDLIHCQAPDGVSLRASEGYGSEVADDIPAFLAGQSFDTVKLYVAEWLGGWQDPAGVRVNIYDGQCPPPLAAQASYTIAWGDLSPEFYGQAGSMTVYTVSASLGESHTITAGSSIGVTVLDSWGTDPPYAGFLCGDTIHGCSELYWDEPGWGAPRWTPGSQVNGYALDLSYCLISNITSVPTTPNPELSARLLGNFPNPFNPQTRIRFELFRDMPVNLVIFDASGRHLRGLLDGDHFVAGRHEISWQGKTDQGVDCPSGLYLVRLEAGGRVESRSMIMLR